MTTTLQTAEATPSTTDNGVNALPASPSSPMPPSGLSIQHIMATIPHRYPFLLLDRVLEVRKGEYIKALKNVTMNEPYFQGHFPDLPIMPGVLQIEALAQAGAFMVKEMLDTSDRIAVLTGVDNFRFRRMVKPGDQLILEGEMKRLRGSMGKGLFTASVDGDVVASGEILFSMVSRSDIAATAAQA